MPNTQGTSQNHEKRAGKERRQPDGRPRRTEVERRSCQERRQTSITEISYFEWASHFIKFHGLTQARKSAETGETSP